MYAVAEMFVLYKELIQIRHNDDVPQDQLRHFRLWSSCELCDLRMHTSIIAIHISPNSAFIVKSVCHKRRRG
jgi:hypothetical protein